MAVSVRQAREAKGLSQSQLDALLRLAPGTVGRWERGMVPVARNRKRLAKALDVPVDDIAWGALHVELLPPGKI